MYRRRRRSRRRSRSSHLRPFRLPAPLPGHLPSRLPPGPDDLLALALLAKECRSEQQGGEDAKTEKRNAGVAE